MTTSTSGPNEENAPSERRAQRSPWHHHVMAWGLGLIFGTVRVVPGWLAYGVADLITPLIVLVSRAEQLILRPRTRGLLRNQRIVFRDQLTPQHRRKLYFGWARHMAWLFVDFCRMPRITRDNVEQYFDLSEFPPLLEILERKEGTIFVTGHIGCFELCGHLAGVYGYPLRSVMRPIPLKPVDDLIGRIRRHAGQLPLSKVGVVRPLKRALEENLPVGIVGDENTKSRAIHAPFLGTAAATTRTPALLHRWTKAPIVVVTCERLGRERYKIRVWDVIEHDATDDEAADHQRTTRRINDGLTRAILESPKQWFWETRRFRSRPKGEVRGDDRLPPPLAVEDGGLTAEERQEALARL